jgi:hypothetical protein
LSPGIPLCRPHRQHAKRLIAHPGWRHVIGHVKLQVTKIAEHTRQRVAEHRNPAKTPKRSFRSRREVQADGGAHPSAEPTRKRSTSPQAWGESGWQAQNFERTTPPPARDDGAPPKKKISEYNGNPPHSLSDQRGVWLFSIGALICPQATGGKGRSILGAYLLVNIGGGGDPRTGDSLHRPAP